MSWRIMDNYNLWILRDSLSVRFGGVAGGSILIIIYSLG
jgi:hypothetical protein